MKLQHKYILAIIYGKNVQGRIMKRLVVQTKLRCVHVQDLTTSDGSILS